MHTYMLVYVWLWHVCNVYIYVYMYVCMYVRVYVCTYVSMCG